MKREIEMNGWVESICSHLPADVDLLLLALVLLPHPPFLGLHQLQLLDVELLHADARRPNDH